MAVNFEPSVVVNTSFGETRDNSISRLDGLICAAPVKVADNAGWRDEEWYRLYPKGARTQFINEVTGVTNGRLTRSSHISVFNIYRLLGSMSVLVLRANMRQPDGRGGYIRPGTELSSIYGTALFRAFSGYIGVTDATDNNVIYLDKHKNLINKVGTIRAKVEGTFDISSVEWSDVIDALEDYGACILSYHYDSSNKLVCNYGYSSNRFTSAGTILDNARGTLGAHFEVTADDNVPNANPYNFAVIKTNSLGLTETRDYVPTLTFELKDITDHAGKNRVKIKIDGQDSILDIDPTTKAWSLPDDNRDGTPDFGLLPFGVDILVNAAYDKDNFLTSKDHVRSYASKLTTLGSSGTGVIPRSGSTVEAGAQAIVDRLVDYDEGYRIDFIFDSGIIYPPLQRSMADVAEKIKALAVATVGDINSVEDARNVQGSTGVSSYLYRISPLRRVIMDGPNNSINASLGVDYLECVARNKTNMAEFAPVFHFTNAYVADSELTKTYTKRERTHILEPYRINSVKRDKFRNISFINDNWTANTSDTSLGNEEQIVRMANRMGWDIQYILDQFLGRLDVKATADAIKTEIQIYYKSTFGNQRYAPSGIEVICDESNNRFGDGQLEVTVNIYIGRALKKITVFNNILPLTSYE